MPSLKQHKVHMLSPLKRDDWSGSLAYASLKEIDELSIKKDTYRYVPQAGILEFSQYEFTLWYRGSIEGLQNRPLTHVGSEGFNYCSALFVHEPNRNRYIFSHLEPFEDYFYYYMDRRIRNEEALEKAEVVIIYGSLSRRQIQYETAFMEGRWGGAKVSQIEVETGEMHWAVSFDLSTGKLAIVRKVPDQSILYYQAFGKSARMSSDRPAQ